MVSLADFAPTFVELSGMAPDSDLTGKSLVPFLNDQKPDNWRDVVCTQCNGVENYFTQRMVFDYGLGTAGGYIMVSTAPWGPEEAYRESAG